MTGDVVAVPVVAEGAVDPGSRSSRWVHASRRIMAEPARVYRAWTEPAELVRWLPFSVEGAVEPGMRAVLAWPDRSTWWEPIRLVPPRELSFRWPWLKDEAWRTIVTVRIRQERNGTLVSLEDGPFDLAVPRVVDAYAEASSGWAEALAQLRAYLDFGVDLRELPA